MNSVRRWSGPAAPATDPAGPTGRLCGWLQDLGLADIPAAVRERAKDILLDGLSCGLVGSQLPWSRRAVEAALSFEGEGACTLIGWERTAPATTAALLNSTFIQGFELDDVHPRAPLHSAAAVAPALLACAEALGDVSGADLLLAAVAGFEVGPRVGLALHGAEMLSRGWHSGAVFGAHAAAAACGVLLRLDAARCEDALGMAATQSGGLMAAQFEAMCKRMQHGFSSRNGLFSALMASGGYTGIKRVYERDYGGFLSVFGEGHAPLVEEVACGLGRRWETLEIKLKPYAAMGGLHAALDNVFDLIAEEPIRAQDVARIDVELSQAAFHHGWWRLTRPITPVAAQMNVAYAVAVAILDRAAMVEQFSPARIDQDDVWALVPKIEAHHNPAFDKGGPGRFPTRLIVTNLDGRRRDIFTANARSLSGDLGRSQVVEKVSGLTGQIVSEDRRRSVVDLVLGLETLESVDPLLRALGGTAAAAFEE